METRQEHLRFLLRHRVGGFFHNTRYIPGTTCRTCRGPGTERLCAVCQGHSTMYGARLADQVLTLAYARGNAPSYHQSAHTLRAYKDPSPSRKAAEDLALMVLAATLLHHGCVTRTTGAPWDAVSFVPPARRPGREHPVSQLARQVHAHDGAQRFLLVPGPSVGLTGRTVLPDRFAVAPQHHDRVRDHHVLIVDDTWTTGSKAQSAALAARAAGARHITILCVARWCRHDWDDHRTLLDRFTAPYDAAVCPVTGGPCPTDGGHGTATSTSAP